MALGGHPRISDATRKRVQDICRELGYRPRRSLPTALRATAQVRDQLRLAFFAVDRMDRPVNASLLEALTRSAAAHDMRLELASLPPDASEESIVERAAQLGRAVDGMILMGPIGIELLRRIAHSSVPAVMYGYPMGEPDREDWPVPIITSDFAGIGHRATRALIESGHRRVGFISGPLHPGGWHSRCLDGYATAHLHARLTLDHAMISTTETVLGADDAGVLGARAMLAIAPGRRPTAYVAINPGTAARFIRTMKDEGSVTIASDQLVICGYRHMIHDLGVENYPLVYMDAAKIADAALNQLKNECIRRTEFPTTVLVPFSARGLPAAANLR
jgi:LacI family transcriptional regulator